ncbi:hypothetical protein D3C84_1200150 [compost metagenome]
MAECWGITVNEEEETLAEKLKQYIFDNIALGNGVFKDKQIRADLEGFLKALIRESKVVDWNYPVYEGILKVENDYAFAKWICNNLERFRTI